MADRTLITPEYLRQRIAYDPQTGALEFLPRPLSDFPNERIWKGWNSRQVGKPAFAQKAAHGYMTGRMAGVNLYAHRVAWMIVHGNEPDCIDHINGDGWDNRLANLRSVSHAENLRNMKAKGSGQLGIVKAHNRWRVRIGNSSKVGTFATLEEAKAARKAAEAALGYAPEHGAPKQVRR